MNNNNNANAPVDANLESKPANEAVEQAVPADAAVVEPATDSDKPAAQA